jgi:hypothetical protein
VIVQLGVQADRLVAGLGDERHAGEADAEQADHLLNERPRDLALGARAPECVRQLGDRAELAVARRDPSLSLLCARDPTDEQRAVAPAHDQQRRRDERGDHPGERQPHVPAEGPPVAQDEDAEDPGGDGDPGEDEDDRPVEWVRARAVPPEQGQHRPRHGGVGRSHQEER